MSMLDSLVYSRRSIRKYKRELPPADWIEEMISSALQAPSAANRQPIRFFRISSPQTREKLSFAMEEGCRRLLEMAEAKRASAILKNVISNYCRFLMFMFDAPLLFAVGTVPASRSVAERLYSSGILTGSRRTTSDDDLAVGMAAMEWMLKGEELGLGSCILTAPLLYMERPEDLLAVSPVTLRCFLTLGFPDETPAAVRRKNVCQVYREI